MQDLVNTNRKAIESGGIVQHDILSLMIQSNIGEGKLRMSDDELVPLSMCSTIPVELIPGLVDREHLSDALRWTR